MANNTDTKVRAKVWLKPEQVEQMRNVIYQERPTYLQSRDDAIITTLYDTGLRNSELVALNVDHLRDDKTVLYLPGELQKDYPTKSSPRATRVALSSDTHRTISQYLATRWKDTEALFPSRSSDRMTTQAVRDLVTQLAEAADVSPYLLDGSRGAPADVSPHTFRHSVAYRMLAVEDGNTIHDVRKRLRHRSIQTTEKVYDHFDVV